MRRTLAVLLVAALALAACGDGGDDVDAGSPPEPGDPTSDPDPGATEPADLPGEARGPLDGGEYVVTSITEGGEERSPVAGSEIRITFDVPPQDADALPSMTVSAGCNQLGFSYDLVGAVLHVGTGFSTSMGCEPELMDQDAWLTSVLEGEVTWARADDGITLTADDVVLTLRPRGAVAPDAELVGPTWTLDTLVEGEAASSLPAGTSASLTFLDDGTYQVDTGCNTGSGGYTGPADDGTIEVDQPAITRMACLDEDAAEVEAAVLAVLAGTVTAEVTEQRLTLTAGDRGLGLTAS